MSRKDHKDRHILDTTRKQLLLGREYLTQSFRFCMNRPPYRKRACVVLQRFISNGCSHTCMYHTRVYSPSRLRDISRDEAVVFALPLQSSVERPDPKGLSTFSQCTESLPHGGFELMSSRSRVRRSN